MSKRIRAAAGAALLLAAAAPGLFASSYLFYLEAQGIAGWSSALKKTIFYSLTAPESMQKPGIGFDYVQKFSGNSGDIATLAVQGRLAVNTEGGTTLEPQLYNAFLKLKTSAADIWAGHNKPYFGLSSILDNHGTLLQPLSMYGFGFDRDWGLGFERQFAGGNAGLSLTSGSGMPLKLGGGSYFLAGRAAIGVLAQDNFAAGLSAAVGRVYDIMGYELQAEKPADFKMIGLDASWVSDNWANSVEVMGGSRDGRRTLAAFWRTGVDLLDESRLKLEAQPMVFWTEDATRFLVAGGTTFLANSDLTFRAMVSYDSEARDVRIMFQIYYYKGIRF
jgi:hypothetical protein